jgi:quinol monooxygenase YgiN
MGSMAIGSATWGRVASMTSTSTALTIAVVVGGILGVAASRWRLAGHTLIDRSVAETMPEPTVTIPLQADEGPVMVNIEYLIDPAQRAGFERAMADVRKARLRNGAIGWGLFQDANDESRFVETFIDPTWLEHLRRRERITLEDVQSKQIADAFHRGESAPRVSHFIARGAPRRRHFLRRHISD